MDIEQEKQHAIFRFLQSAGLLVESGLTQLDGQLIPRELLLCEKRYKACKESLNDLKRFLSSSCLTSLQTTAEYTQKWPLLNAVRQILKANMIRMVPIRVANGYTKEGKKIVRRMFRLEKLTDIDVNDQHFETETGQETV